jgi:hypothetical protein
VYQQQQQEQQQDAENPFLDPPFSRIKITKKNQKSRKIGIRQLMCLKLRYMNG